MAIAHRVEARRISRQGFPEAIYCPGKTHAHILDIFGQLLDGPGPVIATRVPPRVATDLLARYSQAVFHSTARLVTAKPIKQRSAKFAMVVSAGTADVPVAEEAAVTLETLGCRVARLFDVGVAGIHRLLAHEKRLKRAAVAVVCAGMDGALPSVVGGLASCPVIAVPTSIGYGAGAGGIAALLTMMNSCAANVSVVNIDNGFGAGVVASLIIR